MQCKGAERVNCPYPHSFDRRNNLPVLDSETWNRDQIPPPSGAPAGSDGKESACSVGDLGSIPGLGRSWVGKTSWRRQRQPTPVFLPGESHGQRGLVGYSPWGHKELVMTLTSLSLSFSHPVVLGDPDLGTSRRTSKTSSNYWGIRITHKEAQLMFHLFFPSFFGKTKGM